MPTAHGLPYPPSGVVIDGSEVLWVDKEIGSEWFTYQFTVAEVLASIGGGSPLTTKGDVYTRSSSANARLAVGVDYSQFMADSTTTTGNKWVLNKGVPLAYFGTLNNNGTSDDSAVVQAAYDSGEPCIDARGLNLAILSTVNIKAGVDFDLLGTNFNTPGDSTTTLKADTQDGWALRGPFTINGEGATVGTAKGIHVKGCNDYLIDGYLGIGIKGHGFYLEPGAAANGLRGVINNCGAEGCYIGWEDLPGSGAEYTVVNNWRTTTCTVQGTKTSAGNLQWIGGQDLRNVGLGFVMVGGSNHAHGIVIGRESNHNGGTYNWSFTGVINGQTLIGCHGYEKDTLLDGCKGIVFVGGKLDVPHITVNSGTGSGDCMMLGVNFPNGYGDPAVIDGTDPDSLILKECTGPGNPGNNDIRIIPFSADYTYGMNDEGIVHPSADTSARDVTVPTIATIPFRVGKVLSGDNQDSAGAISLLCSDTVTWLPTGATGTRTIAPNGNWALKLVAIVAGVGEWQLTGVGIT